MKFALPEEGDKVTVPDLQVQPFERHRTLLILLPETFSRTCAMDRRLISPSVLDLHREG